jgi:hypothetical protein
MVATTRFLEVLKRVSGSAFDAGGHLLLGRYTTAAAYDQVSCACAHVKRAIIPCVDTSKTALNSYSAC